MKLRVLLLIAVFLLNVYAAPLIFKTKVSIAKDAHAELATIDVSKYKKIRIFVQGETYEPDHRYNIEVYGVDDLGEYSLQAANPESSQYQAVIDVPPDKIKIKARGRAIYTVRIWGE